MVRRVAVALLCAVAAVSPVRSLGQESERGPGAGPRWDDEQRASLVPAWNPTFASSPRSWRNAPDVFRMGLQDAPSGAPSPTTATLLSLALPGAGQHVLGQRRKWIYLAVEIAGWALWVERRSSAADYEDAYRDFAWDVGRIQSGPRVDGDFDYYERMTKWGRSGTFDSDPASAGVQPERDATTYNGSVWELASGIFIPPGSMPPETDPAYQSALAYYQQRAYGMEFLWDWPTSADQQELGRLIGASDDRYGQATTMMGVVIANHLVSAVDAYLSARGRAVPARLRVVPAGRLLSGGHGQPGEPGWHLVLSVGVGR